MNTATNQTHSGSGDNVGGDKHVYMLASIRSTDVVRAVKPVLIHIRHRNFSDAKAILASLRGLANVDTHVITLFNILDSAIARHLKEPYELDKNTCLELLSSDVSDDVKDIVNSVLLVEEMARSEELARQRYHRLPKHYRLSTEAYLEFLALIDELEVLGQNTMDLTEAEQTGLVRGAYRLTNVALAVKWADQLHLKFPTANSNILFLLANSFYLTEHCNSNSFFLLDKCSKDKLMSLSDLAIELLPAHVHDNRVAVSILNLLQVSSMAHSKLIEVSIEHLATFKKIEGAESIVRALELVHTERQSEGKGRTSAGIRKLLRNKEKKSLTFEEYAGLVDTYIGDAASKRELARWLVNKSDEPIFDDPLHEDIANLTLQAMACSVKEKGKVAYLARDVDRLLSKLADVDDVSLFANPILALAEFLLPLQLSIQVCKLLQPYISKLPWMSPLFRLYLHALYDAEQYATLAAMLDNLEQDEWTFEVWGIKARMHAQGKEFDEAIKACKQAISINHSAPLEWQALLRYQKLDGLDSTIIQQTLESIHESIWASRSDSALNLLIFIANNINYHFAEYILADWFIQDPEKYAVSVVDLMHVPVAKREGRTDNPYTPTHCIDGVIYTDDNGSHTKLLVNDIDRLHPCQLDIDKPKGAMLYDLREGESDEYSGITLQEKLPPYTAIIRVAIELRLAQNQGDDQFYKFSVPQEQEQLIPYMEQVLRRFNSQSQSDDIIANPNIPVCLKGHRLSPHDPVKAAVNMFMSKESNKSIQWFKCESTEQAPITELVVDVYSAVYLSLSGYYAALKAEGIQTVMTDQTIYFIRNWLTDITHDDYLSIDVDEQGLIRTTGQTVRKHHMQLIEGLKHLLDFSRTAENLLTDTSTNLIRIRDVIDMSVFSSYQLAQANNIPWLCMDIMVCHLAKQEGLVVVEHSPLFTKLVRNTPAKLKVKPTVLHAIVDFPMLMPFNDVLTLSGVEDNDLIYSLSVLVSKYGVTSLNLRLGRVYLASIFSSVILQVCYPQIKYNPNFVRIGTRNRLVNSCFDVAVRSLTDQDTAEERVASLVISVFEHCTFGDNKHTNQVFLLLNQFINGYFLDARKIEEFLSNSDNYKIID